MRAIKVPSHFDTKKQRLKPAAFRPAPGTSAVSVIRHVMGSDFCKDKSVEIAGSQYIGLGCLVAAAARAAGSSVVDAQEDFIGHAHIDHGVLIPNDEPLPAVANERLISRLRMIVAATTFHEDPAPDRPGWAGAQI